MINKPTGLAWLSSLLGLALLLVALLDITLVIGVGWMVWRRATLSEYWLRIRQEDQVQEHGNQREARDLEASIATAEQSINVTLRAFPGDADVARYLSALRTEAAALGVTIHDLSPRATTASLRRYAIRAQGPWVQLVAFLNRLAQTSLLTTRLEDVALESRGEQAELTLELEILSQPPNPLALQDPANPMATASRRGSWREE